jgi:hypothetical protein
MPIPPHEQLQAVVRGLSTVERDGQTVRVLNAERTYTAEVVDVWDALTSPERVPRWLAPLSGDLREGRGCCWSTPLPWTPTCGSSSGPVPSASAGRWR